MKKRDWTDGHFLDLICCNKKKKKKKKKKQYYTVLYCTMKKKGLDGRTFSGPYMCNIVLVIVVTVVAVVTVVTVVAVKKKKKKIVLYCTILYYEKKGTGRMDIFWTLYVQYKKTSTINSTILYYTVL